MYVFLGGRMYDHRGVGIKMNYFMVQQLFYWVVQLIPKFTQTGGAALTRNKKGPYGPIFLLP